MQYKNVGIYNICRTLKGYDKEYFYDVSNRERAYIIEEDWENVVVYMDEAEIGSVCDRTELSRMFADAAAGKLNHICICTWFDLWHDAKTSMDEINKLRKANPSVGVSVYGSIGKRILLDFLTENPTANRLAKELLELQRMDGELSFLREFYRQITPELRNDMLQFFVDPTKLDGFLEFFYLEPQGLELEDLKNTLGLSKEDTELIRLCVPISDEGYAKLMDWVWQDLLAYYLV